MVLKLLGRGFEGFKNDMRRAAAHFAVGNVSVLDGDDRVVSVFGLEVMYDYLTIFAELRGESFCESFHEVYS
ncbi:hypothetical protein SDC9_97036 [bioreactor metagenome]|uniref:Uncharacterized protein n=1 Tax=bioreactor metagenome TaxID=1076179 RepID=A0A645ABA3_9ZZZZ